MFIGLDIGDSRVGVALAVDKIAPPTLLGTYERSNGRAEREVLALIKKHGVSTVVAGMPLGDSSERTPQCESVESFCRRLSRRAGVAIEFIDEYASTLDAEEQYREARQGKSRKQTAHARRKGVIDALAAVNILERYLNTLQDK